MQEKVGREVYYSRKVITPIADVTNSPNTPERQVQPIAVNESKQRRTQAQLVVEALKQSGREMSQKELMQISGIKQRNFSEKMERYVQKGEVAKRREGHGNVWRYVSEAPTRRRQAQPQMTSLEMVVNRVEPLQAFCNHLGAHNYAKCSWELYSKHITHFYKYKSGETNKNLVICAPERFAMRDFDDFITHCRNDHQLSPNTLVSVFTALKMYFKFLQESHYIVENFLAKTEIPDADDSRRAVGFSLEEFKQMLTKAKSKRDETLLLFLFATGARVGEVESFKLQDLNWEANKVTIHGEKVKKVASRPEDRIIDIPRSTMVYLREYIEKYRPKQLDAKENAVFLNANRTFLKARQIESMVRKVRIAAGIRKKVVVHSFRHACITYLYENGHDIYDISKHVGHKNVQQTWAYIIPNTERRTEKYQQTHPLAQLDFITEVAQIIVSKEAPQ
jgi:integrase/recombinase XerD